MVRARSGLAAPVLVAGLLLAACRVEVDGAPCATAGATADCPAGQACGNDRRCSARALACAASRCAPGADDVCLDPSGAATGVAVARRCSDRDPVCGAWDEERCADRGLECGRRSGSPRCECPAARTRALAVKPDGAPADALPFASGVAWPPGCAYRTLTDGLAAAKVLHDLDPSSVVTLTAAGASAGGTVSFSAATGERFPILVSQGVALRSDRTAGGAYEILFDAKGDPGGVLGWAPAVELRAGTRLEGFTVRNGVGGPDEVGIYVECFMRRPPVEIASVDVEGQGTGGGRLGTGIYGRGPCPVVAEDVHVRDAGAWGIWWEPDFNSTARLSLLAGSVTGGAGTGIVGRCGGGLLLDGTAVTANAGRGVDVQATDRGAPALEIRRSSLSRNGTTGLAVAGAAELRVSRTTVFGNLAQAPVIDILGLDWYVGGVLLSGEAPGADALELWGNRIYANRGNQLLLMGPSTRPWYLDHSGACADAEGPLTNVFGCYDPGGLEEFPFVGINAVNVGMSALGQWWPQATPAPAIDFLPKGIPVATSCTSPAPLSCDSELPP